MLAQVFIDRSLPQINQLYSYRVDPLLIDQIDIGKRVLVPFGRGNKMTVAIVIALSEEMTQEFKLKSIEKILDNKPVLSKESISLGLFMRSMYFLDYAQAFRPLLPGKVIGEIEEKYILLDKDHKEYKSIFKGKLFVWGSELSEEEKNFLNKGIDKEIITIEFSRKDSVSKRKIPYLTLTERERRTLTEKQKKVISLLEKKGPLRKKDILLELSISQSPVESLLNKGYIQEIYEEELQKENRGLKKEWQLNKEQRKIIENIVESKKGIHLIHGVTGSGKTEIYIELVKDCLRKDQSAIVLVPEISLTPQIVQRFKDVFGDTISVLHSRLTYGEKAQEWLKVAENTNPIVIGARSALFAPVHSLGLIIIDEEHEESYRYHDSLRYNTGEVAEKLGEIYGAKVVYGSATPSLEIYHRAKVKKEICLHVLSKRANPFASPPSIEIVDMREELEKGNTSIFSNTLYNSLQENLKKNQQSILFLNRRGFSHFISCRACGYVIKCRNCDISMTYHKNIGRLRCHYCGETKPLPHLCPQCKSPYIKKFGIGTEQVEEMTRKLFPLANIARMDRDTMQKKDSYEKIYQGMKNGSIDILIGTQMLAKGFDFERLSLVGIIAADSSLYIPDFRSQEKTFQLLTQVSGRAGRFENPGRAIIQTYSPNNYSIELAQKNAYEDFYTREIEERKKHFYPPFSRILTVRIWSDNEEKAYFAVNKWQSTFWQMAKIGKIDLEIMEPNSLPKIQNRFSFEIGIKVSPKEYPLLKEEMRRVLYNYYQNINEEDIRIEVIID